MDNDRDDIFDSLRGDDGSERVRLRVMGLSYSQIQNGAYALILAQVGGPMRIPVVIGASEAQAIAIKMEGITTPRPMTHDLFTSLGHAFGLQLQEVFIYRFEDGVFYSEMTYTDGERTVTLDSRTSDAVAIAMRTGSPIYTTAEILERTGFELDEVEADRSGDDDEDDDDASGEFNADSAAEPAGTPSPRKPKLENYSLEELRKTLNKLIDNEEYEEAARVAEIIRRKEQPSTPAASDTGTPSGSDIGNPAGSDTGTRPGSDSGTRPGTASDSSDLSDTSDPL